MIENILLSELDLIKGVNSTCRVSGLTHNFYRYPARFAPEFVRAIVQEFTQPGDLVVDPFMGGGTALIEGSAAGRIAIGSDISSLATFISRVKTTPLTLNELDSIYNWTKSLDRKLNIQNETCHPKDWIEGGYLRHLNSKRTWRIRKLIELAIASATTLQSGKLERFARCAILSTAQWALDNRKEIPEVDLFRKKIGSTLKEMSQKIKEYEGLVRSSFKGQARSTPVFPYCLNVRAQELAEVYSSLNLKPPELIITSPPYPGVHILYHRWQIQGRKETPAPFWITDVCDGQGSAHYTFGDRNTHRKGRYYKDLKESFESIARIADKKTLLVQMIGFTRLEPDLDNYLQVMEEAGYKECMVRRYSSKHDGRLWREIPNRKWYALKDAAAGAWKEVVLFHNLST